MVVQLRTSHSREFQGALHYNSPDYPVNQPSNGSLLIQWSIVEMLERNSAKQKSEHQSQRAPDCPVQQDDKGSNGRPAPNPNGCTDVACTGQCTVAVRWRTGLSSAPIASRNQPTARRSWEAINTPNHLIHFHPSISEFSFIAIAKAQHFKTQSKQSIHSKPQNQL
jgi:hypothetical protein